MRAAGAALLHVDRLAKQYHRGMRREVTFSLEADFTIDAPCVVGVYRDRDVLGRVIEAAA